MPAVTVCRGRLWCIWLDRYLSSVNVRMRVVNGIYGGVLGRRLEFIPRSETHADLVLPLFFTIPILTSLTTISILHQR